MKKVLILGSGGMLGHVVYSHFKTLNKFYLIDTSFTKKFNTNSHILDVRNNKEIELYILKHKPDVVINCIGVLLQGSQKDPSNAIYINSYFPHFLSKTLSSYKSKLIHISTDCVFSGAKGDYKEIDFKDSTDVYGLSKSLGEIVNENDLTIRTSIIGPELKIQGNGLFNWFMLQKNRIKGYTNVFWSGVTTLQLAKALVLAIENDITGLYHITNQKKINKMDLLTIINKYSNKNLLIDPLDNIVSDKSFLDTRKEINFEIPSYDIMIKELVHFIRTNISNYPHYDF